MSAPRRSLYDLACAKVRGVDCSEEDSARIKRYFDDHDPDVSKLAAMLCVAFPIEWAEWCSEYVGR